MLQVKKLNKDGSIALDYNGKEIILEITDDHFNALMQQKKPLWAPLKPVAPKKSRFGEFALDSPQPESKDTSVTTKSKLKRK